MSDLHGLEASQISDLTSVIASKGLSFKTNILRRLLECLVPSEVLETRTVSEFVLETVWRNGCTRNKEQEGKQRMMVQTTLQWANCKGKRV